MDFAVAMDVAIALGRGLDLGVVICSSAFFPTLLTFFIFRPTEIIYFPGIIIGAVWLESSLTRLFCERRRSLCC